jgi:hypothetical protein
VSPQPNLASEKRENRDGDMQMLIALASRRKCPRMVIAPQLDKLFDTVETLNERFAMGHGIGHAPFAVQKRVKS